jgi:S-adenosylmethionine synthetase
VHGTSHPDTICDGVAEAASVALCRAYLDGLGDVGDDLLLEGGAFEPWPFPI